MSASKRVGIQLPLAFSSGLPLLLTGATLTAWLQDEGVDIVAIGAFALVQLPYNFKFAWAPLLDRFGLPFLGRRRGWMVVLQLATAAALVAMGTVGAGFGPMTIAVMAIAVAFLSASQDVVYDAYRTDVLEEGELGKGSGAMVTGFRVGMIVAGAGALLMADWIGWNATYWVMAALMLISVVATFMAPEPSRIHQPKTLLDAVVRPFLDFFRRRGAILALAIAMLYKFGDAMAAHMIVPFLMDIGFPKTEIGLVQKFGGLAATIAGAWVGGAVADRIGVVRGLLVFGAMQALANLGYIFLALAGPSHLGLGAAVLVDNLFNGMGTAAFVAYLMSLCDVRYSAFQYALLTSASSILARTVGAGAGFIVQDYGWAGFFIATVAAGVPALALIVWYRVRASR